MAAAAAVAFACSMVATASAHPERHRAHGWLTGEILIGGGPLSVVRAREPEAGWVHVVTLGGEVVSVTHVAAGETFKIKVPKGVYEVFDGARLATSAEDHCRDTKAAIHPGVETEVSLYYGCDYR